MDGLHLIHIHLTGTHLIRRTHLIHLILPIHTRLILRILPMAILLILRTHLIPHTHILLMAVTLHIHILPIPLTLLILLIPLLLMAATRHIHHTGTRHTAHTEGNRKAGKIKEEGEAKRRIRARHVHRWKESTTWSLSGRFGICRRLLPILLL